MHVARDLERVGPRSLLHGHGNRRRGIERGANAVVFRAQFDACHVAEARDRAAPIGFDDDALELLGRLQPAVRVDVELERGIGRGRRAADGANRRLNVLTTNGRRDIVRA
ncbi:hypothetical protein D3C87_1500020 [compost metagenome]